MKWEVTEAYSLASGGFGSDRGQNEKNLRPCTLCFNLLHFYFLFFSFSVRISGADGNGILKKIQSEFRSQKQPALLNKLRNPDWIWFVRPCFHAEFGYGAKFVVPFSSHSRSLALKPSLSSHQMTTLFVQNDKAFTQMMIFFYPNRFLSQKKHVIWWL